MEKVVVVRWRVQESETARILDLLPELAEKSKSEPGTMAYAIYRSETDSNEFFLIEHYADAAAAESHKQTEHYQRIVASAIRPYLETREVTSIVRLA